MKIFCLLLTHCLFTLLPRTFEVFTTHFNTHCQMVTPWHHCWTARAWWRDLASYIQETIVNHGNDGTCLQPNSTFICHPAAGPTVHQDRLFQACFPVFSTDCLELAATNSSDQWLSVSKSRLKTFLFSQAFTEYWSDLPPAPLKLRPYNKFHYYFFKPSVSIPEGGLKIDENKLNVYYYYFNYLYPRYVYSRGIWDEKLLLLLLLYVYIIGNVISDK